MGASAQQILQSDPEYLQRQLIAQEQQRLNPQGTAAGALGILLGRGLSNVSQGKGFFQAPDTGLQRVSGVQSIMQSVEFDPNNPADYYNKVGVELQRQGFSDLAPLAFQEARKTSLEERKVVATEKQVEQGEKRISLDRERLAADIAKEARLGRLTEAQIREVDARIKELGASYDIQAVKGPAGETLSYVAINKKNPSDVKTIDLNPQSPTVPTPTPTNAAEWNYVPGQGLVKGK